MTKQTIRITCDVKTTMALDKLENFQPPNFKTISDEANEKIKASILKHGFFAPVLLWKDKSKIMDGHHRVAVLRQMEKDGFKIPNIPVVEIEAANETEVAEKILQINSAYARITNIGLESFMEEFNLEEDAIEEIELAGIVEIKEPKEPEEDQKEPNKFDGVQVILKLPHDISEEFLNKLKPLADEYNIDPEIS